MEYCGEAYTMRKPCINCGSAVGRIETKNGQDCVYCACGKHQYNAPKIETGRKPRTVTAVHDLISASQRARIITRATGRCEICGARGDLQVGHLISVKDGLKLGMTEAQINDDENLAAMCPACNLGIGESTVPLRLAVSMVLARMKEQL